MPFATRPEGRTPGKPERYATAMDLAGNAIGLLVTCVDGRPTKIEGNPLHPQSLGASHALAQAAVLELYDPDRSRNPVEQSAQGPIVHAGDGRQDKWAQLRRDRPRSLPPRAGSAAEPGSVCSPRPAVRRRWPASASSCWRQMPEAQWFEYEPLARRSRTRGGQAGVRQAVPHAADARPGARHPLPGCRPAWRSHPASLQYAREFAQGREVVDGTMNRLYVVESGFSVTGAAADHRLPLRSSQIAAFVGQLAASGGASGRRAEAAANSSRARAIVRRQVRPGGGRAIWPPTVAERLIAVGPQQPPEVHAAVHRLNADAGKCRQDGSLHARSRAGSPRHTSRPSRRWPTT